MANIVDNKIVEMQFDNKDFEKNVEQSITTLEDLKKELKLEDAAEGFNEIDKAAKNMDLSSISESIQSISDRFSTMGIVAMTVISEITSAVFNTVTKMASTIGGLITQGGLTRALNIEKAKFQLEGLGVAWEDIYDNIDAAVTGTAYSLDSAALVASQLVASGVEYGDELSGMAVSLRAISGVAAMTSSTYDEIGSIFTTVAGQGKLMTMQLRQLESRGLNAAATLGKYLGKTEAEVRDMVTNGKIDFETFSAAMNDAFGDHAMEANKTLTGVLANTKSALGRIGAEFLSPIIQNEGPLVNMFESLRVKINEIKAAITPLAKIVSETIIGYILRIKTIIDDIKISKNIYPLIMAFQIFDNVASFCELTLRKLASIFGVVKDAFKEIFPDSMITSIAKLTTEFINFYDTFELTSEEMDKVKRSFKGFFAVIDIGLQAIKGLITPFFTILGISGDVAGEFLDATASLGDFLVYIDELIKKSKIFDTVGEYIAKGILAIAWAIDQVATYIYNLPWEKVADYAKKAFTQIEEFVKGIPFEDYYKKVQEVFGNIVDFIINSIGKIDGIDPKAILNFFDEIKNIEDPLQAIKAVFEKIFEQIKQCVDWLATSIGDSFAKIDITGFKEFVDEIKKSVDPIDAVATAINLVLGNIGKVLDWLITKVGGAIKTIGGLFAELAKTVWESLTTSGNMGDALKATTIGVVLYQLKNVFIQLRKLVSTGIPTGTIVQSLNQLSDTMFQWEKSLNADYFIKLAGSILIMAYALKMLSDLNPDQLATGLTGVTVLLTEMSVAFTKLSKTPLNVMLMSSSAKCLITFAMAVLILTAAVKALSELTWEQLATGLAGVTALIFELTVAAAALGKVGGKMTSGCIGLIALAAAVRILAGAVKELGEMKPAELLKGVAAVEALIMALSGFAVLSRFSKGMISTGLGMIALAAAIRILVGAVDELGSMDIATLSQGLIALQVILMELAAFSVVQTFAKGMISTGLGMIALAAAVLILTTAIEKLGTMDTATIVQGLIGLQVLLAELAAFQIATSLVGNSIISGVGLIAMAAGVLILASALKVMASMNGAEIAKSLITLGIALTMLSGAMIAMSFGMVGAAAMLVMAAALAVLVPQIILLGAIPTGVIANGLKAIAIALGIFLAAAALSIVVAPGLIVLSTSLLAVGASSVLLGVGLVAIGAGLTAIITAITAFGAMAPASIAAATASIKSILTNLATLFPEVTALILGLFNSIYDAAIELLPKVLELFAEVVVGICDTVVRLSPTILNTIAQLFIQLLETITSYTPQIIEYIGLFVVEILEGLAALIPQIAQAAVDLVTAFIQAIADSQVKLIQAAFDAMISFINGLADAIDQNMPLVVAAMNRLFDSVVRAAVLVLTNSYTQFKEKGKQLIIHLKTGITGQISNAKNAMSTVINGVKNTITTKVSDFTTVGKNIVQGLINGLNAMLQSAIDTASALGTKILNAAKASLGIQSPSKKFKEVGKFVDLGLIKGMQEYSGKVEEASKEIATSTYETMSDALSGVSNIVSDLDGEPVITPVIDTTKMGYIDDVNTASNIRLNADVDTSFNKPIETLSQIFEAAKAEIKDSNQKVIDSVNGLKDDLTELLSTDQELGLYVDGKKLASTLAKPMNRQLNVLATRGAY